MPRREQKREKVYAELKEKREGNTEVTEIGTQRAQREAKNKEKGQEEREKPRREKSPPQRQQRGRRGNGDGEARNEECSPQRTRRARSSKRREPQDLGKKPNLGHPARFLRCVSLCCTYGARDSGWL